MRLLPALAALALTAAAIGACGSHRPSLVYDGTCATSLQAACEDPRQGVPCPPTWSASSCTAIQPCSNLLALPGGYGFCVFDAHTHALVAAVALGIDTPPWCNVGNPSLTIPEACVEEWQEADCPALPPTGASYCCPTCDAGAPPALQPPQSQDAASE